METDSMALELLREVKHTCKRNFILFVITLFLLFATNIIWIYVWTLPSDGYEITQDSSDNGNNSFIGNDGEVINYGKTND